MPRPAVLHGREASEHRAGSKARARRGQGRPGPGLDRSVGTGLSSDGPCCQRSVMSWLMILSPLLARDAAGQKFETSIMIAGSKYVCCLLIRLQAT